MQDYSFRPLTYGDIPLLHGWFNTPHVQTFFSLRDWTEAEVLAKYKPVIEGQKSVYSFIILGPNPIGFIQYCPLIDHPWPEQEIPEEVCKKAAGVDLFLAEPGKGIGSKVLKSFLMEIIWPKFSWCFADPDVRNEASIRCFQKSGFQMHKVIFTEDALKRPVNLMLMIAARE